MCLQIFGRRYDWGYSMVSCRAVECNTVPGHSCLLWFHLCICLFEIIAVGGSLVRVEHRSINSPGRGPRERRGKRNAEESLGNAATLFTFQPGLALEWGKPSSFYNHVFKNWREAKCVLITPILLESQVVIVFVSLILSSPLSQKILRRWSGKKCLNRRY